MSFIFFPLRVLRPSHPKGSCPEDKVKAALFPVAHENPEPKSLASELLEERSGNLGLLAYRA